MQNARMASAEKRQDLLVFILTRASSICGECVYCRSGNYNLCPNRLGFGYGLDGAMAELQ
jgi:threonine dehydrogenase-like Zn-dependent dehydrogenase